MAGKKTSAEQTKEEQKDTHVGNMLDAAFGDLGGLQKPPEEEVIETTEVIEEPPVEQQAVSEVVEEIEEPQKIEAPHEDEKEVEDEVLEVPTGPPSGPPSNSPTGPPSGPPSKSPTGPPSGPPSKSPTGPPSGPPPNSPTGPPSGPPPNSPTGPPSDAPSDLPPEPLPEEVPESESDSQEVEKMVEDEIPAETEGEDAPVEHTPVEEEIVNEEMAVESVEESKSEEPQPEVNEQHMLAEQEIARLNAEVERLRQSVAGAADVIEELENPPMPPAVIEDIVIGAYIVGDFARLARQLDREQLIRATMGTIAMLHPENLSIMISTRNRTMLPRLDERGLCAGLLGQQTPPRGAPSDWRVMEVILASVSIVTGGPAAVIHSYGACTTAVSSEKDLVLVQPIDVTGKEQIGKVIIVDPDYDNLDNFLRQTVEALKQGGMRCVVVRGMGAYAVGADLDQAWANAAMLEHSMRIVLLARQANLKI